MHAHTNIFLVGQRQLGNWRYKFPLIDAPFGLVCNDNCTTGCSIWIVTKVNECCDYVFDVKTLFTQDLFWKCVYILICGTKFFFQFLIFLKRGGPFKKFKKKIIPKIKIYTCFQHKSEGKSV